jgi:hypothetical protein
MSNSGKTDKAYERTLKSWAKDFMEKHPTVQHNGIDLSLQRLINQSTFDLFYGPVKDGSFGDPAEGDSDWDNYPGFQTACKLISDATKDVPSTLYIDTDAETWQEEEPEYTEKCPMCLGLDECSSCNNAGVIDLPWDAWWQVHKPDLMAVLLGKELARSL